MIPFTADAKGRFSPDALNACVFALPGRIRLIFTQLVMSGLGRVLRIIVCLKRNNLWHEERPYCTHILIRWDLSMLPDLLGGQCVNPTLGKRINGRPRETNLLFRFRGPKVRRTWPHSPTHGEKVHPRGFEPLTFGSVDRCSIQLS